MKRIAGCAPPVLLVIAIATSVTYAQQIIKWKNSAEYTAYMMVYSETDHAKRAANAEKFLADHPDADPAGLAAVYRAMLQSYANAGNWGKVLETYNRMGLAPNLTDAERQQFEKLAEEARAKLK
jgi:pentatricopeptide repeat protein